MQQLLKPPSPSCVPDSFSMSIVGVGAWRVSSSGWVLGKQWIYFKEMMIFPGTCTGASGWRVFLPENPKPWVSMVMAIRARLCREGRGRARMHGRSLHMSLGFPSLGCTVGIEITRDQTSSRVFLCLASLNVLGGGYVNISGELSHYLRIKILSNEGEKSVLNTFRGAQGENANEDTSGSTNPLLKYYPCTSFFKNTKSLVWEWAVFIWICHWAHRNSGLAVLNQELRAPWLKSNERRLKRVRGKWDFLI